MIIIVILINSNGGGRNILPAEHGLSPSARPVSYLAAWCLAEKSLKKVRLWKCCNQLLHMVGSRHSKRSIEKKTG